MRRTVDEKAVIMAVFKERPQKLIDELESVDMTVFERNDGKEIMLLILCEPPMTDLAIDMVGPYQERAWDPFSVEIRSTSSESTEELEAKA